MTEPIIKRADQLVVGDRILPGFLPSPWFPEPGEVVYVKVHDYRKGRYVFVAYMQDNGFYDSTSYEPGGEVEVYPADTGLSYSHADDGETTQPIAGHVPPHFGGVVNVGGHAAVEVAGGLIEIDPPVPASEPRELLAIVPSADGGVAFALAPTGAVTDPVARAKAVELTEAVAAHPPEGFVPAQECLPECGGGRQCQCQGGWS